MNDNDHNAFQGYPPSGQPYYNSFQELSPTVTKMDWFLFTILACIPVVNLLALIYYAFDKEKPSRANLAILQLILLGATLGFFLLCALFLAGVGRFVLLNG
ncbi:MAG: hypothetical protein ACI4SG_05810 [Oligosphaeraceae bacterium]